MTSPPTPPASVLIADEPFFARAVARILESDRLTVTVVNSLTAVQNFLDHSIPDALILGFEGGPGVQVLDRLSGLRPGPELIVVTESSDSETAVRASKDQIMEVFEKPTDPSVVAQWTHRLLRRRRGEPESVTMERSKIGLGRLIGNAPMIDVLRQQVLKVAEFPLMTVLVYGESGTGKELVARTIHDLTSPDAPFVRLDCGSLPENMFELELFGQDEASDAPERPGLLECARGGTAFLDEVGALPAPVQAKLFHCLESRSFRALGGSRDRALSARVVAATSQALTRARDLFRPDLYYRLAGITIETPALRDRADDILLLANVFLREFCRLHGRPLLRVAREAAQALMIHDWPGNVRELRGVVESAAVSARAGVVRATDVQTAIGARINRIEQAVKNGAVGLEPMSRPAITSRSPGSGTRSVEAQGPPSSGAALVGEHGAFSSLPALEEHVIRDVYRSCRGNLSLAARTLGIPRSTLRDRLKKYGIAVPSTRRRFGDS